MYRHVYRVFGSHCWLTFRILKVLKALSIFCIIIVHHEREERVFAWPTDKPTMHKEKNSLMWRVVVSSTNLVLLSGC